MIQRLDTHLEPMLNTTAKSNIESFKKFLVVTNILKSLRIFIIACCYFVQSSIGLHPYLKSATLQKLVIRNMKFKIEKIQL